MILYSHVLYERLAPWLSVFERRLPHREIDSTLQEGDRADVLLTGLGRYGAALAEQLRQRGCRLLGVDFDPGAVEQHARDGYRVHYGDAEDPEFVATLPLAHADWVVSTVRDPDVNRMLLHGLRQQNYPGKVAIATSSAREARRFEAEGVDLVLIPYADAAREAACRLVPAARRPAQPENAHEAI